MRHLLRKLVRFTPVAVAITALLFAGNASAQLVIHEAGFDVTDLGLSVGAKNIECSPGGIWGDFIYIADSNGDVIERVDNVDLVTLFATLSPGAFPVGMAFGPGPGSDFGDFLYVSNYGLNEIVKITSAGVVSFFTTITAPASNTFDPSGAYGNEMFVASAYSGPIWKVTAAGVATSFSTVPAAPGKPECIQRARPRSALSKLTTPASPRTS